jgi:hypothetical protein
MSSIFHYTSNEGAIGIINSGCLYATNYKYLNDSRELDLARHIVVPLFAKEFSEEADRLIQEGKLNSEELKSFGSRLFEEEANNLFESAITATDRTAPIFITSLCRHNPSTEQWEHGLLSQWRGYGAFGGCALEIDEEELKALTEREKKEYRYAAAFLAEVQYNSYADTFDMGEIDGLAAAFLRNMVERTHASREAYDRRSSSLFEIVAGIAPTLKSSSFAEEGEVRIVASHMRGKISKLDKRQSREILMRFKNGSPIPYLRLFDGFGQLPIKRIIVGPQRDQGKNAYALELALEAKGITAQIARSNISYLP